MPARESLLYPNRWGQKRRCSHRRRRRHRRRASSSNGKVAEARLLRHPQREDFPRWLCWWTATTKVNVITRPRPDGPERIRNSSRPWSALVFPRAAFFFSARVLEFFACSIVGRWGSFVWERRSCQRYTGSMRGAWKLDWKAVTLSHQGHSRRWVHLRVVRLFTHFPQPDARPDGFGEEPFVLYSKKLYSLYLGEGACFFVIFYGD